MQNPVGLNCVRSCKTLGEGIRSRKNLCGLLYSAIGSKVLLPKEKFWGDGLMENEHEHGHGNEHRNHGGQPQHPPKPPQPEHHPGKPPKGDDKKFA